MNTIHILVAQVWSEEDGKYLPAEVVAASTCPEAVQRLLEIYAELRNRSVLRDGVFSEFFGRHSKHSQTADKFCELTDKERQFILAGFSDSTMFNILQFENLKG